MTTEQYIEKISARLQSGISREHFYSEIFYQRLSAKSAGTF